MFWNAPFNETAELAACMSQWGVSPRVHWANTEWGGKRLTGLSNVVFSNGLLDPWHGGGVLESYSDSVQVRAVIHGSEVFFKI